MRSTIQPMMQFFQSEHVKLNYIIYTPEIANTYMKVKEPISVLYTKPIKARLLRCKGLAGFINKHINYLSESRNFALCSFIPPATMQRSCSAALNKKYRSTLFLSVHKKIKRWGFLSIFKYFCKKKQTEIVI